MPVDEYREPLLLMQDYIQEIEILHDAYMDQNEDTERGEEKRIAFCGCIE